MTRSLLFLSYLFPPRGGAGVQRSLKFVKYLPQFGWKPLVVANGGAADDLVTKIQDPTLLKDLPTDGVVRYTKLTLGERSRFERGRSKLRRRLEPTDPMRWWIEPAVRTGLELLGEHDAAALFVTMSPFTAAEAGIRLKQRTGLPLVLDLRDPWALDETKIYPTRWHARRDWNAMARALAAADLVVMNTPESARAARAAFPVPAATRVVSLTNGFDADDFAAPRDEAQVPPPARDVLRIVHTGMFHSDIAEIWDAIRQRRGLLSRFKHARRPIDLWSRSPRYLLAAMESLVSHGAVPKDGIDLVLVGELTASDLALVDRSPVREMVKILGYRTHAESVQWLKSADALFLPLHTPLDGKPALIVPGKAYEYLGSGTPILVMGPPGDMRDFIAEAAAGIALDGNDVPGAAAAMKRMYDAKRRGETLATPDADVVRRFERRELSRRLAEELDRTVPERTLVSVADPAPAETTAGGPR